MESEREPASPSQSSLWPLALLGTAVALLSLRKPPAQTVKNNYQPIHPKDSTDSKGDTAPRQVSFIPKTIPSPQQGSCPDGGKKRTPRWEKAAVLVALGIFAVNAWQSWETRKSAGAAKNAAETAQAALTISEQAHVTIGRPDGVVAEIVWPKDQKGTAALLVYFQNNGHFPARFNWGNSSPLIAIVPTNPKVFKEDEIAKGFVDLKADHWFQPMYRAKVRSSNSTSWTWSGTIEIGGNSSYQGVLWEMPKERMVQLINLDRPLMPSGKFDYCDGFGKHVCRTFSINYAREYGRFFLASEDECSVWEMQVINPKPDFDYLPPCEISENRKELQTTLSKSPKP